jgi:hypothetical protein
LNATLRHVVVGLHRINETDSRHAVIVDIARTVMSPGYGSPNPRSNDVMLIELKHPVTFNEAVSPICLPAPTQTFASNTRCYATGWGTMRWRKYLSQINEARTIDEIFLSMALNVYLYICLK